MYIIIQKCTVQKSSCLKNISAETPIVWGLGNILPFVKRIKKEKDRERERGDERHKYIDR